MSETVFKYTITTPIGEEYIHMPQGARILSVAEQFGNPVLYALVDPNAPTEKRLVLVRYTGDHCESGWSHAAFVGTVLLNGGQLVLHVFVK